MKNDPGRRKGACYSKTQKSSHKTTIQNTMLLKILHASGDNYEATVEEKKSLWIKAMIG